MLPYYLVDGIYPSFAFLISPHPKPTTEEQTTFNRLQEAIRKDMERLFGVLMQRSHIALHPGWYWSVSQLVTTYKAISISHNMCVKTRRCSFLSGRRRVEGDTGGTNTGVGGDAGGAPGFGNGQSGGVHAVGAAATRGPAPGGGAAVGARGVADAMGNTGAASNAPPAVHPAPHPPTAGISAKFDARAETQNSAESERLRDDLTADIFRERGDRLDL